MAGVKRTVRIGLIAYRDPSGAVRRAQAGTKVEVHPDHVDRFDALNMLLADGRTVPSLPSVLYSEGDSADASTTEAGSESAASGAGSDSTSDEGDEDTDSAADKAPAAETKAKPATSSRSRGAKAPADSKE